MPRGITLVAMSSRIRIDATTAPTAVPSATTPDKAELYRTTLEMLNRSTTAGVAYVRELPAGQRPDVARGDVDLARDFLQHARDAALRAQSRRGFLERDCGGRDHAPEEPVGDAGEGVLDARTLLSGEDAVLQPQQHVVALHLKRLDDRRDHHPVQHAPVRRADHVPAPALHPAQPGQTATADWGGMISDSRNYYQTSWWFMTFPGAALVITTLAFNLFGDGVRDAFDPRKTFA